LAIELWGKHLASKKLLSTGAVDIARSEGCGMMLGSVLSSAVDAITTLFLIVLMILMEHGYGEM